MHGPISLCIDLKTVRYCIATAQDRIEEGQFCEVRALPLTHSVQYQWLSPSYHIFYRALLKDIATLGELDGYAGWRLKEAAELSDLVQRRLYYLQNPADCKTAKKLVCNLNKVCYLFSLFAKYERKEVFERINLLAQIPSSSYSCPA